MSTRRHWCEFTSMSTQRHWCELMTSRGHDVPASLIPRDWSKSHKTIWLQVGDSYRAVTGSAVSGSRDAIGSIQWKRINGWDRFRLDYKFLKIVKANKVNKTRPYIRQHQSPTGGQKLWCSLDSLSAKISTAWPTDGRTDRVPYRYLYYL